MKCLNLFTAIFYFALCTNRIKPGSEDPELPGRLD